MGSRCEWCSEESVVLIPVVDRDLTSFQEHNLVCPECADVASDEHTALWNIKLFGTHGKIIPLSLLLAA